MFQNFAVEVRMKRLALNIAIAALMALAGCADEYGSRGFFGISLSSNSVWYDDYYGPYPGGYWSGDGVFFYSDRRGNYQRDDGGHFRHGRFENARKYKPSGPPRDHGDGARHDRKDR
jgi:hypothetical protein